MTNEKIIYNAAIAAKIYTEAEAAAIVKHGASLPLHTYAGWKSLGLQVKRGEHAKLAVKLWKHTQKKVDSSKMGKAARAAIIANGDDPDHVENVILVLSYLFALDQVEKPQTVHIKSKEEIAALNAELAAQRKAARA